MSSFQNNAPIQNQAGQQIIHGNIIFNDSGTWHKRSRLDCNDVDPEQLLDDDILASLAFPHMSDRRSNVEPPHYQTCQWLFKLTEYETWKAASHGLLWIKGLPGSGKSTLMSHLYSTLCIEQRPGTDINLQFFFSARGAELQRTPLGMFRALLNQLFYQDQSSRDLVRKAYQEKSASFGSSSGPGWEWQLSELKSLLSNVVLACAQRRQTTIFIDALDEAGQRAARETAHYFHSLNDRVFTQAGAAKICISCRHYPVPSTARAIEVHVERHNKGDIEAYIKDYLSLNDLSSDLVDQQTIWYELLDDLINMARGVFQWVCLVIPMVGHWMSDGCSPEVIRKQLSLVPSDLEDVYRHIIEKVIDHSQRRQSLRLFQWVCLAMRPLSITEMRYAIAALDMTTDTAPTSCKCHEPIDLIVSDKTMTSRIRSWSGGLIEVAHIDGKDNDMVQVIHQSVNEFLRSGGLWLLFNLDLCADGLSQYDESEMKDSKWVQKSHGILYFSCLTFFSSKLWVSTRDTSYQERSSWLATFSGYSSEYCLVHAQQSGTCRSEDFEHESLLLSQSLPSLQYAASLCSYPTWHTPSSYHTGTNALQLAALAGLDDLVQYKLDHNADVMSRNTVGWTALHFAAYQGHLSTAKILVGAGADVRRNTGLETPLLLAARRGHTDVFAWLMAQGASINEQSDSEPLLYAAAVESHLAICRLCLDAGVDVNAPGGRYGNALQAAACWASLEVVRLLLEAGANVHAQGGDYGNALQAAAYHGSIDIVRLLLEAGADVNAQGGLYGNALQAAAITSSVDIVRLLLEAGADVNARGGLYGNALQAAATTSSVDIVRLLLEAGADVNAQGGMGGNVLQLAASFRDIELVRLLLEAGADINAQGGEYGSALQAAARYGNIEVVRLLLEAGADVNAHIEGSPTALQYALADDRNDVANLLRAAGAVEVESTQDDNGSSLSERGF